MRLWSLHPKYLDTKGLLALWRETLLAKKVLEGETKGYKNHPQLIRFKEHNSPLAAINQYLSQVHQESLVRGFKFNKDKFQNPKNKVQSIKVNSGQIEFEKTHLLKKLKLRDQKMHKNLQEQKKLEVHPIFSVVDGNIHHWEVL